MMHLYLIGARVEHSQAYKDQTTIHGSVAFDNFYKKLCNLKTEIRRYISRSNGTDCAKQGEGYSFQRRTRLVQTYNGILNMNSHHLYSNTDTWSCTMTMAYSALVGPYFQKQTADSTLKK